MTSPAIAPPPAERPCGLGVEVREDGEWAIIHRCTGCGILRTNRIAGDDLERSLLQLALRPLTNLPFPID